PAEAAGQPRGGVDELRQSRQANRVAGILDARKKDLDRRVGALRSASEMSRALLATEWSEDGLEAAFKLGDTSDSAKIADWLRKQATAARRDEWAVTALDLEMRNDLANRLEKT